METNQKKLSFQMLALITTPKLADKAAEIFKRENFPLQYRFRAEGTAPNEIIDMLGLGNEEKCVLMSVLPKEHSRAMLNKLKEDLQLHKVNSGIGFTVSLKGISNLILRIFTKEAEENGQCPAGKDETKMTEMKYVLVTAIVNRGYSADVMEVAQKAGAKGGTVIHSLCVGNEETAGFWGLNVQEEKEIVLILTEAENKVAIMQTVCEHCGMHSEAQGVAMALPIDSVVGL